MLVTINCTFKGTKYCTEVTMAKDCNYQLKITISGDEKRRIEQLAKLRYLTVPQYIKLTALGVKIQ